MDRIRVAFLQVVVDAENADGQTRSLRRRLRLLRLRLLSLAVPGTPCCGLV